MIDETSWPTRPLLRPGVRVTRRGRDELQVGLADDLALRVPDTAMTRDLLDGLWSGTAPGTPASEIADVARELLQRGLVVDSDAWCARLGTDPLAARTRTAVVAEAGTGASERFADRAEVSVAIDSSGLPEADSRLRWLLEASAVPVGTREPDLVVVLREGEPDRAEIDELIRADQTHLLLTVVEGRVAVGPFVQPAVTACLRCVDASLSEGDPRRALVVQQYADSRGPGPCGMPEPVPADLLDVAVGIAARDVTRWADRLRPSTWSTTIEIDAELTLPRTYWRRHGACGCSGIADLTG